MEVWDKKIRSLDAKIIQVDEAAARMESDSKTLEKNLHDLVTDLTNQFKVPGIIGHEDGDMFRDISTFIRSVAEFKDESDVIFSTMIERRLEPRLDSVYNKIKEANDESAELVKVQQ